MVSNMDLVSNMLSGISDVQKEIYVLFDVHTFIILFGDLTQS